MLDLLGLYQILKPTSNPTLYTQYPLLIGATGSVSNLDKGVWVINLINTSPLTKSEIILSKEETGEGDNKVTKYYENQRSIITTTYQLDFYKAFDNRGDTDFIVQQEAVKMREWLNSYEIASDLKGVNAEILPTISTINFTSELGETKSILSRASFDFEVVSWQDVKIEVNVFKDVELEKGVIL